MPQNDKLGLTRKDLAKIMCFSIFDSLKNYCKNKEILEYLLEGGVLSFAAYGPSVKKLSSSWSMDIVSCSCNSKKLYNEDLSFLDNYIIARIKQGWFSLVEESHSHKLWRNNVDIFIEGGKVPCRLKDIIENYEDYYNTKLEGCSEYNKLPNGNLAISEDEYFMSLAKLTSLRSEDPNTKVGACLVTKDGKQLSVGYNKMPDGCSNYSWKRNGEYLETKYPYVIHAEINAILSSLGSLKDSSMYVTLFPCSECSKAIIQSGIKKLYYESDKYHNEESVIASKRMLE